MELRSGRALCQSCEMAGTCSKENGARICRPRMDESSTFESKMLLRRGCARRLDAADLRLLVGPSPFAGNGEGQA